VLVDRDGSRVCDESRYGAAIGEAIMARHRQAWLLADRATLAEARRQLRRSTLWFQRLQAFYLLTVGRVSAPTVAGVASRAGIDPAGLAATVAAYNAFAASGGRAGRPENLAGGPEDPVGGPEDPVGGPANLVGGPEDPAGKSAELLRAQDRPPYSLIDCSIRPRLAYPAPMLTLGGLVVAEETGQVRRADGTTVHGLYAAGPSAVGLCSRSYVSGLSLADCVFSGRRAGGTPRPPCRFRPPVGERPPWDEHRRAMSLAGRTAGASDRAPAGGHELPVRSR
jgi:3-oxo-5alpha-steroid 4-dehydrogenase